MKIRLYVIPLLSLVGLSGVSQASSPNSSKCSDFSGKWKGTCTVTFLNQDGSSNTQSFNENKQIQQEGCANLTVNDTQYKIGETYTTTSKYDAEVFAYDWNEDQTVLKVTRAGLVNGMTDATTIIEHDVTSGIGKWMIENGHLAITMSMHGSSSTGFDDKCVLDKQ